MAYLEWRDDLNTGIDVIDGQHKRIVDYINRLYEVCRHLEEGSEVKHIITELVDYTLSHFAFEESLLEEAGYGHCAEHIGKHNAFRNQIFGFKERAAKGENVADELLVLLQEWLFEHIKSEDGQYVGAVLKHMEQQDNEQHASWITKQIHRMFGQ